MATKFLFKTAAGNYLKVGNAYAAIPDPSLYANDSYIPFVPAGGFQDVSVLATFYNSWNPSSGAATWITFSNIANNGGDGWGSFRATASSNSGSNRTGTISVKAKCNTWNIDVSQNGVSDSVSSDYSELTFDGTGSPLDAAYVTLTSSGTWTASKVDTGDGTTWLTKLLPASGSDQGTCTPLVQSGYEGAGRSCIARFTVGTAHCDVTITQVGVI
jgi:hypothetical protein